MVNLSNSIHPFKEIHLSLRIFDVKWKSCSSKAIKGERGNQQVSLFAVKLFPMGFILQITLTSGGLTRATHDEM